MAASRPHCCPWGHSRALPGGVNSSPAVEEFGKHVGDLAEEYSVT